MEDIRWIEARGILARCHFLTPRTTVALLGFFSLGVVNAILDGLSVVLVIDLLTSKLDTPATDPGMVAAGFLARLANTPLTTRFLLGVVVFFLLARVIIAFVLGAYDGRMGAAIRRRIQEQGVSAAFAGDWASLRDMRVGRITGALTEEVTVTVKYFMSIIRAVQAALTIVVLGLIASAVSLEMTLVLVLAGLPALLVLQLLFARQARFSARHALVRQEFAGDIVDRLSGLFQIKVGGKANQHAKLALREQNELTRLEVVIGYFVSAIGSFSILLPAIALVAFAAWAAIRGQPIEGALPLLAQVGTVGTRAASQMTTLVASWGNLSRLSGSLPRVHEVLTMPAEPHRSPLPEPLARIEVLDASYQYEGQVGAARVSFGVARGEPLVLRGPSGSGKTTIANLVSGLYRPDAGEVRYLGASAKAYSSLEFRARVGYVAQDIYLFHGTIRENLDPAGVAPDDDALWTHLKHAGADEFVRALGGLDAILVEAGRSLSGGQKRRLGIARALVGEPDLVIFDEITSGLDPENRRVIHDTVLETARTNVVLIITHEEEFSDLPTYRTSQDRASSPRPL